MRRSSQTSHKLLILIFILILAAVVFLFWGIVTSAQAQSACKTSESHLTMYNALQISMNEISLKSFQKQQNSTLFETVLSSTSPAALPIVIFAGDRPNYLSQTLQSLQHARQINQCLLFVSHDTLDSQALKLVRDIPFTPNVIQLVHPVPPHAPNRIALKNHWWWLMENILADNGAISTAIGLQSEYVLFLEDDHVVSPDFYTSALALMDAAKTQCKDDCWGFSLYSSETIPTSAHHIVRTLGVSNTAYAMKRSVWKHILASRRLFYDVSDGWDEALRVVQRTGAYPSYFLAPTLSRVKNVGKQGVNVYGGRYDQLRLGNVVLSEETADVSHFVMKDDS